MNILITGITGFIGQNMVGFFGKEPAHKLFGSSRDPNQAKDIFGDTVKDVVSDIDALFLKQNKIDVIIHLAGIAHDLSNKFVRDDYFKVNYEQTIQLFDLFLRSEGTHFVFFSSIKAAADTSEGPIDEMISPNPVTPYGQSKLLAEKYLTSGTPAEKKKVYIIRPSMIYGPGNKGNLNLLYQFVKKGIPYPLGAFENKRSFIYIDNLLYALDRMLSLNVGSGIYNFADSRSLSTKELIRIIGNSIDKRPRIMAIPQGIIKILASFGSMLGFFFGSQTLKKLTESGGASNTKLLKVIESDLPYSIEVGLSNTIRTFG